MTPNAEKAPSAPPRAAPLAFDDQDVAAEVRAGLQIFLVAVKNCALYPENNKIRQASLAKAQEWFAGFLDERENLKLFVDIDGLLYQGVNVLQEKAGETNVFFPLFRDGVQWIEFQEGLDAAELNKLIELLIGFRMLKEDDEDDLVTAMWGAELQFVKYKTANEFWEIDPITEIASFKVGFAAPGAQPKTPADSLKTMAPIAGPGEKGVSRGPNVIGALFSYLGSDSRGNREASLMFPKDSQLLPPRTGLSDGGGDREAANPGPENYGSGFDHGAASWELNDSERTVMEDLLSDEARLSQLNVGLDLTLALLVERQDPPGRALVLKFLAEMVRFSLAKGEFQSIYFLLRKFEGLIRAAAPALDHLRAEFQARLSTVQVLDGLAHYEAKITSADAEKLVYLGKILNYLELGASRALAEIAAQIKDETLRAQVLAAVAARARAGGLELALHLNVTLAPKDLVTIVGSLAETDISQVAPFLIGLSRHVRPEVREAAATALLSHDTNLIVSTPHLLAEPESRLQRQIYWLLGQKRSAVVEKAIVKFLRNTLELGIARPPDALLVAYRTLGLCAVSAEAVNFCGNSLLKKNARAFFGVADENERAHRVGAALALIFLSPGLGQDDILARASKSFFRGLKRAYEEAKAEADAYYRMARPNSEPHALQRRA
ncbi:MAG: hypothetical protein LBO66_12995 [Deltaproteobacteria bacterium]|jgi:hypothetical protein|nr:hypothetical protein [Deltaproteobacteria bacterium]